MIYNISCDLLFQVTGFMTCACINYCCRLKGIKFVAIDLDKPLSEQGPFDIVLHKVNGTV